MEGKVSLKDNLFSLGQQLGKAIMMPISILPVAGLLLGISAALSDQARIPTPRAGGTLSGQYAGPVLTLRLKIQLHFPPFRGSLWSAIQEVFL